MNFRLPFHAPRGAASATLAIILCALIAGCGGADKNAAKPPVEVGYQVLAPTSTDLASELPGRTEAFATGEVRPQVSGVIQRRLFTEGALVRAGQPLYQIDASLSRAAVHQAEANLASAESHAASAKLKADRYRPLAADQAVSQQDYTDAQGAAKEAAASVAQARAALDTARINLRYTTVPAPVSGRIGRSLVTEGALASAGQAGPLAVISVLDPMYVNIQESSNDLLALRNQLANGGAAPLSLPVRLKLDDGSFYAYDGKLEFSEVTVDPATGSVTLRARFPNPRGMLLPGMFVRAELTQARATNVFLVPQSALTRDARGNALVFVVGAGDKAELRPVTTSHTQGPAWIVTQGLKAGDRLITQGLGHIRPGAPLHAVPDTTPQHTLATGK